MAGEKDIELRIRARDDSEKTLDRISKRIAGQSKAFEDAARKAEEARAKQAAYAKTIEGVTELTERQRRKMEELTRAVETSDARQQRAADRLEATQRRRAEAEQRLTDEFNKQAAAAQRLVQATEVERLWISLLEQREKTQARVNAEQAEYVALEAKAARAKQAMRQATADAEAAIQREIAAKQRSIEAEDQQRRALYETRTAQYRLNQEKRAASELDAQAAAAKRKLAADAQRQEQALREEIAALERADAEARRAAEAQDKLRLALAKSADEAIAAAKGYATLASSVRDIRSDTLSAQLRGIVNPAKEALRSLDGIEQAVADVAQRAESARGPLKGFRDDVATLDAAQKQLIATAGNVTAYQRQLEVVRQARVEYTKAREEVNRLANEMRQGVGSAETVRQMDQARQALAGAAVAMRDQTQRARELRQALREAGVDTQNLAAAEQRLARAAQQSTAAVTQLTAAQKRYGTAVEQTRGGLDAWLRGERTTLSFFQRLRGELLALTTTYVGLYGAIDLARGSIDAFRSAQAIESRLSVSVGDDAAAIRAEWDYLMMQADRLGFGFEKLALSYSKFSVAARAGGLSQQETRFIFERFAEAARVARLSTDDFEGSLRALEQMVSKNQVTAEELRQQLGDRLPGAVAIFARGAGMSIADFTKQMEQSAITAEFVINAAREMGNTFGGEKLQKSVQTLEASIGRLDTAMFKFKLTIAESGFADAFTDFIQELTEFLNSNDGKQFAVLLSDIFSAVVKVMRLAAQNVDLVKFALGALLLLPIARVIGSSLRIVSQLVTQFRTLRTAISGLAPQMQNLIKWVSGLTTALGLGALGSNEFYASLSKLLRLGGQPGIAAGIETFFGGDDAVQAAEEQGEKIKDTFEGALTSDPLTGGDLDLVAQKSIERSLRTLADRNTKADRRSRLKGAEQELEERLSIAAEEYEQLKELAEQNIKDEQARSEALLRIEEEKNRAIEIERRNFENRAGQNTDRAAERRKRVAEEVAMELLRIEDSLNKEEILADPSASFDERLQARLKSISYEYDKLLRKVKQLARSPDAGDRQLAAQAQARIQEYIASLQALETQQAKQEELSALEQNLNSQVQLRASQLERINALRETGQITEAEALEQIREINTTVGEGINSAAEQLRNFAMQVKELLSPAAFEELMARIDTTIARSNSRILNQQLELQASEQKVNDLLTQRQLLLDGIRQQRELGLITEQEMVKQVNETNGRFRDSITAGAQEVITYAQLLDTMGDNPALQGLVERMKQLQTETQNAKQAFTQLQLQIGQALVEGALVAFDKMAESLAGLVQGTMTWKEAISNVGQAMRSFFAQFLRDIAMAILKQQILNALQAASAAGGVWGQLAAAAVTAASNHTGGTVGMNSSSGGRKVDAAWFATAKRYHSGGLPGLQPNEVPTILQKGEEVLTREDPRHILNGGGGTNPTNIRTVLVDDRTKIPEAMASAEGDQVLLQFLSRNAPTVRSVLR